MLTDQKSRFHAVTVLRLVADRTRGRLEVELSAADGARHVVYLPLGAAKALARLICDAAEATPFLEDAVQ